MRRIVAASLLLLNASAFAQAQTAPFDMSGERPPGASVTPRLAPPAAAAPVPVTPPVSVIPAPATSAAPVPPPIAVQPQPTAPAPQAAAMANTAAPPRPGVVRRFVVPFSKLGLGGEYDRRSWSVYLTPEQAAAKASFTFSYQNSIVVAPEPSALTVYLNNRPIGQQRVGSPDGSSAVTFEVPPGLLQPGANLVTFEADQRHRTDCSIQSTYELWSNIDPAGTYLSFAGRDAAELSSADAIRAIGVDGAGKTEFDIVVPALEQPGTTKPLLRLAQGLSVLSSMPNQIFAFSTASLPAGGAGKLSVLVGTAAELRPLFPGLPPGAESAALAAFATDPRSGSPVLLISGPSWQAVSSAIDTLVAPTDRSSDVRRDVLTTERWSAPNAPLVFSDTNIALSQLGVKTTEFSGRRLRTSFNIAVPADFYANAYGEAKVLLDAAYTDNVMPGSHIDIYVNDNIASTVPITTTSGGILRHLPIRVTMRHFKPGLNSVAIEAILMTKDDAACAPGATAGATPRFALFDTSELQIPDFARVGQRPNLAAMAGTAYPYGRATEPTPLFIDRVDADTLSAAATLLGQMAITAGHPIAVETVASPNTIGDRDAIFIGSISQMPATALSQTNIATASQASWRPVADTQPGVVDTGTAFEEWNSKVSGGVLHNRVTAFREWLSRNFDISRSSLQFIPGAEQIFTPANADTLLVAQGSSPAGAGAWTVVAAPSAKDLREGLEVLTTQLNWPQISGHITTYSSKTSKIETVPVTRFDFVPSTPWSIANYRLIAANWLSTNILSYAFLLVVFVLLIGITTSSMLRKLGRSK
ncbi:cellulose biosynthesis cyclic di-GMP-binding regulatory protein BcsB [Rhizobium leguminosarum]|uniref:cellulose biosynthesis cyclic di-GMP-binding regulatory protein BcsB n=1 Tax=Rhizobium leguminosarum TaxID=384 RepID=UPI001A91BB20|nr:cellulose biosynthesis cyclic di-GMP-binding regulatory protein BcsB [Rhizobium leguminosarum]MBY5552846.1 cellulose biosynthesis cyclic di-GMP-binding regulatory protein BcsB [Rhizobium leguminosarum]MBY5634594.1 cellulose biosynthesis cyclic di-GMP-binding regulatory protein BcsB [Rhizobium leguminosarum]MBY5688950.1 cellulose biosynthesis cyclic di-GMP-binding regulatory protein BcsB [Rhizobium leguminosarum]MBY5722747.1 cellulose biosynthesis cyclic di-GMP-binding regulatory protein BcsB